jgi:hypothetical protein
MILKKVKKGDRITVTGYGITKNCKNIEGIVSHRRKNKVFVVWEGTKFHIEDEMDIREVKQVDGVKINKK